MTENIKDDVFPEHPGPQASTSTPYDDEEEEEYEQQNTEKQETVTSVDLENYFEIVLMTSPVSGIKYYMPIREATDIHALVIQNPTQKQKRGGSTL